MQKKLRIAVVAAVILLLAGMLTACGPAPAQGNLAQNSGFEDGILSPWQSGGWLSEYTGDKPVYRLVAEGSHMGQYAAYLSSSEADDIRLTQQIAVTPGRIYHISGYIKCRVDGTVPLAMLAVENTFVTTEPLLDTDGNWQYVDMYTQAISGQKTIALMLRLGNYGSLGTGEAWFDDISVEEVAKADVPQGATIQKMKIQSAKGGYSSFWEANGNWISEAARSVLIMAGFLYVALAWLWGTRVQRRGALGAKPRPAYQTWLWAGLALAFLIRLIIAAQNIGYSSDMKCWYTWGTRMVEVGPIHFYGDSTGQTIFCDYPPLYLWVLSVPCAIMKLAGIPLESAAGRILLRLPSMLADIALAYMVYRIARKRFSDGSSLTLALLVALNPASIYNSAVWGQIDSFFVLPLIAFGWYMMQKRYVKATVFYTLALLIKPQAIVLGPALAWPLLELVIRPNGRKASKDASKKAWATFGQCVGVALGMVAIAFLLPSIGMKKPFFAVELYASTLSQYAYASLNAFNLMSLLGGNGVKEATAVLGPITYGMIGYLGIPVTVALSLWHYIRRRETGSIFVNMALLCSTFYFLGTRIHERYLFPAILFLAVACAIRPDKRLLAVMAGFSGLQALNMAMVLKVTWIASNNILLRTASAIGLALFALLIWVAFEDPKKAPRWAACATQEPIELPGNEGEGNAPASAKRINPYEARHRRVMGRLEPYRNEHRFTLKDVGLMLAITVVYSAFAFFKLGSTKAPVTMWDPSGASEGALIELEQPSDITKVWFYTEISSGSFHFEFSEDGVNFQSGNIILFKESGSAQPVFTWISRDVSFRAKYVRVVRNTGSPRMLEIGFSDANNQKIAIKSAQNIPDGRGQISADANCLIDEQDCFSGAPTYMDGAYFDEVYHVRTAYEQIHGMDIYETTHPPLGKVMIGWGIQLFGMNPFGWRFMGTLAGVLMLPLMYAFAKALFGKTKYAVLATLLMALDGMHLAQTRLATIDSYPVLFIIAMYYCMYLYFQRAAVTNAWWKSFIPLALSGIAFGLGAASKWICLYAGAGLAVIFFYTVYQRFEEMAFARRALKTGNVNGEERERLQLVARRTPWRVAALCGWCLIFFVAIPACIYYASYLPILRAQPGRGLQYVWDAQINMYRYHSGLTATHPFQSPWYSWPLVIRPIWYYQGSGLPQGQVASIAAFGNPIIWWTGLAAVIWGIVRVFSHKGPAPERGVPFLLVSMAAQLAPWILVTRCVFIYHYFASVPFFMLLTVYLAREVMHKNPRGKWWVWGLVGLAAVLFIFFFPAWTGLPIPFGYSKMMRWMPTWYFYTGW
nr:phospholipid carrier-dependent glycosyltransferase [bacterium]